MALPFFFCDFSLHFISLNSFINSHLHVVIALGSSPVTSSSPPTVGERKLFSNVTRLGFAAAHDSPSLKIQEPNSLPDKGVTSNPSGIDCISLMQLE